MERRRFTGEFKLAILREMESGRNAAQLSREHNIHPSLIYSWKRLHDRYPDKAFRGNGNAYTLEAKLAESQRLIGKLYAENEFLKKVLSVLEAQAAERRKQGGLNACTPP